MVPGDKKSMSPTKFDHAQAKRTLRSGVRGQNKGKFGGFGCNIYLTKVYITLNSSSTIELRNLFHMKCLRYIDLSR